MKQHQNMYILNLIRIVLYTHNLTLYSLVQYMMIRLKEI